MLQRHRFDTRANHAVLAASPSVPNCNRRPRGNRSVRPRPRRQDTRALYPPLRRRPLPPAQCVPRAGHFDPTAPSRGAFRRSTIGRSNTANEARHSGARLLRRRANVDELREMTSPVAIDDGAARQMIVERLEQFDVGFIDMGLGVYEGEDALAAVPPPHHDQHPRPPRRKAQDGVARHGGARRLRAQHPGRGPECPERRARGN